MLMADYCLHRLLNGNLVLSWGHILYSLPVSWLEAAYSHTFHWGFHGQSQHSPLTLTDHYTSITCKIYFSFEAYAIWLSWSDPVSWDHDSWTTALEWEAWWGGGAVCGAHSIFCVFFAVVVFWPPQSLKSSPLQVLLSPRNAFIEWSHLTS